MALKLWIFAAKSQPLCDQKSGQANQVGDNEATAIQVGDQEGVDVIQHHHTDRHFAYVAVEDELFWPCVFGSDPRFLPDLPKGLGGIALLGTFSTAFTACRKRSKASGPSFISAWGFIT